MEKKTPTAASQCPKMRLNIDPWSETHSVYLYRSKDVTKHQHLEATLTFWAFFSSRKHAKRIVAQPNQQLFINWLKCLKCLKYLLLLFFIQWLRVHPNTKANSWNVCACLSSEMGFFSDGSVSMVPYIPTIIRWTGCMFKSDVRCFNLDQISKQTKGRWTSADRGHFAGAWDATHAAPSRLFFHSWMLSAALQDFCDSYHVLFPLLCPSISRFRSLFSPGCRSNVLSEQEALQVCCWWFFNGQIHSLQIVVWPLFLSLSPPLSSTLHFFDSSFLVLGIPAARCHCPVMGLRLLRVRAGTWHISLLFGAY